MKNKIAIFVIREEKKYFALWDILKKRKKIIYPK